MESVKFCELSNLTRMENLDKYYWRNLTNGSTVFCNYHPQCESKFAPDTDIGGWGVSISPSLLYSRTNRSLVLGYHRLHCNSMAYHPDSSH